MVQRHSITSFSNPKLKFVSSLREKRNRDREGLFLIEGYREISRALQLSIDSLWICPELFLGPNEDTLIETISCPVFVLPTRVFEKISYRDRPDGLLAVAKTPESKFPFPHDLPTTILWIEGVEKPGNLGTILRTAEGAGIQMVLISDPKIDLFNPNVVRSSTGALFTLDTYICELVETMDYLKSQGYQILAITPEGKIRYTKVDLKKKTILLFGSEQYGLSPEAKERADSLVYIPMEGNTDSLNLAMAAGILMYESLRQNE